MARLWLPVLLIIVAVFVVLAIVIAEKSRQITAILPPTTTTQADDSTEHPATDTAVPGRWAAYRDRRKARAKAREAAREAAVKARVDADPLTQWTAEVRTMPNRVPQHPSHNRRRAAA